MSTDRLAALHVVPSQVLRPAEDPYVIWNAAVEATKAAVAAAGVTVADDAGGLRAALEIVTGALDATAEDAHAGWAYYGGNEQTTHSGPDDFNTCLDSQCRRRQRYVADARAALAAQPAPPKGEAV